MLYVQVAPHLKFRINKKYTAHAAYYHTKLAFRGGGGARAKPPNKKTSKRTTVKGKSCGSHKASPKTRSPLRSSFVLFLLFQEAIVGC